MDEDSYTDSENEVDPKQHDRLLENLIGLDSKQPVKKPARTEPTLEISEYNLVKSITGNKGTVKLHELTKPLRATASHVQIGKDVKKTDKKTKTLERPLEKPQADKIRRTVAYERTNEEISRWEPVVTSHRASSYLSFPLAYDTRMEMNAKQNVEWVVKSDLEKAIEAVEKESTKPEVYEVETETEAPLTLQEMMDRRKELAKIRRFQSYQEMKARMQNKIKSRKYRRVVRKEKAKQQIKEFEALRETNPEEALKKLDEIEKSRAQERASLRHKSTGKWAKNQQIRAKYDKESRQVLAEQLAISKELTQKKNVESSESEEEKQEEESVRTNGDLEFNFWTTRSEPIINKTNAAAGVDVTDKYVAHTNEKNDTDLVSKETKVETELIQEEKHKTTKSKRKRITKDITNKKVKKQKKIKMDGMSGDWDVDDSYIDDLANKLEDKLKNRLEKKSRRIKRSLEPNDKKYHVKTLDENKKKTVDLTLNKTIKKPIIDEALEETDKHGKPTKSNEKLETLKSIINSTPSVQNPSNGIEPNKYLKVKPVDLETDTPDLFSTNDNEENADMHGIIAEAFEDEDITEDFAKDKQGDIEKDAPQDIDLFLPGWGSWGGTNIKNATKRKRFITKLPKDLPRKDKNKGDLIVNERASKAIKPHMVSELPFPFKSVKDYEASVRAPIGNTFVPEIAFRRLTKPAVTTKLGTVIDPVDEDVLMRKMRKMEKVLKIKK